MLCLTIIGISFGIQSFEFVPLALFPFGREIISAGDLRADIGIARADQSSPIRTRSTASTSAPTS